MTPTHGKTYDLEERLLDYGARIINLCRLLHHDLAERHIAGQLLRSGTAPASHHAEAQAAESNADFIHKMRIALKELRESDRWLKLLKRSEIHVAPEMQTQLLDESDQLIRIFITSIRTAEQRKRTSPTQGPADSAFKVQS